MNRRPFWWLWWSLLGFLLVRELLACGGNAEVGPQDAGSDAGADAPHDASYPDVCLPGVGGPRCYMPGDA